MSMIFVCFVQPGRDRSVSTRAKKFKNQTKPNHQDTVNHNLEIEELNLLKERRCDTLLGRIKFAQSNIKENADDPEMETFWRDQRDEVCTPSS